VAVTDSNGATSWFASTEAFSSAAKTSPTFPSQSELKTLLLEGASFNSLAFTPGVALSLGNVVGFLPEGTITAFGLYTGAITNTQRFDSFTINQVPEPSAAMLGMVGLLAFSSRRRRTA
jgi:MYXO-CTERM domain-containing protein